jgi:hypothetical protein
MSSGKMGLMKLEVASLNVVPRTLMIALQQHIGPRRKRVDLRHPDPISSALGPFAWQPLNLLNFIWDELPLAPNAGKSSASVVRVDALSLELAV